MRRALLELEPGLDVAEPQTIAQALDRVLLTERLVAKLTTFFGALALVLAGIGLFGVVSYRTARRTSEIGIRMALGAQAHTVRRMILLDALPMIALGILAGSAACLSIAPHVESFLVGVSSRDAASIAASAGLLMIAGTFAAWWPARRASRIQPHAALRME
jgi:ABC-type antimicrobial peptide transport system permease subunit